METFLLLFFQVISVAILLIVTVLIPIGIPGAFISSFAALIWFFATGREMFEIWHLVLFFGAAILGEVLEQIMGMIGAKKFGSSKKGMWGAMLGGILGAILGSFIPIPVVGSIIGVFVGCFALTFAFEYFWAKKNDKESLKAGMGALIGKVVAVTVKYAVAFSILIIIIVIFIKYDINFFSGDLNV